MKPIKEVEQPEKDIVRDTLALLERATDHAKSPMMLGRVTRCEIGNFATIAPVGAPPVAYVSDRFDAELFAKAPELLRSLTEELLALREAHKDLMMFFPAILSLAMEAPLTGRREAVVGRAREAYLRAHELTAKES